MEAALAPFFANQFEDGTTSESVRQPLAIIWKTSQNPEEKVKLRDTNLINQLIRMVSFESIDQTSKLMCLRTLINFGEWKEVLEAIGDEEILISFFSLLNNSEQAEPKGPEGDEPHVLTKVAIERAVVRLVGQVINEGQNKFVVRKAGGLKVLLLIWLRSIDQLISAVGGGGQERKAGSRTHSFQNSGNNSSVSRSRLVKNVVRVFCNILVDASTADLCGVFDVTDERRNNNGNGRFTQNKPYNNLWETAVELCLKTIAFVEEHISDPIFVDAETAVILVRYSLACLINLSSFPSESVSASAFELISRTLETVFDVLEATRPKSPITMRQASSSLSKRNKKIRTNTGQQQQQGSSLVDRSSHKFGIRCLSNWSGEDNIPDNLFQKQRIEGLVRDIQENNPNLCDDSVDYGDTGPDPELCCYALATLMRLCLRPHVMTVCVEANLLDRLLALVGSYSETRSPDKQVGVNEVQCYGLGLLQVLAMNLEFAMVLGGLFSGNKDEDDSKEDTDRIDVTLENGKIVSFAKPAFVDGNIGTQFEEALKRIVCCTIGLNWDDFGGDSGSFSEIRTESANSLDKPSGASSIVDERTKSAIADGRTHESFMQVRKQCADIFVSLLTVGQDLQFQGEDQVPNSDEIDVLIGNQIKIAVLTRFLLNRNMFKSLVKELLGIIVFLENRTVENRIEFGEQLCSPSYRLLLGQKPSVGGLELSLLLLQLVGIISCELSVNRELLDHTIKEDVLDMLKTFQDEFGATTSTMQTMVKLFSEDEFEIQEAMRNLSDFVEEELNHITTDTAELDDTTFAADNPNSSHTIGGPEFNSKGDHSQGGFQGLPTPRELIPDNSPSLIRGRKLASSHSFLKGKQSSGKEDEKTLSEDNSPTLSVPNSVFGIGSNLLNNRTKGTGASPSLEMTYQSNASVWDLGVKEGGTKVRAKDDLRFGLLEPAPTGPTGMGTRRDMDIFATDIDYESASRLPVPKLLSMIQIRNDVIKDMRAELSASQERISVLGSDNSKFLGAAQDRDDEMEKLELKNKKLKDERDKLLNEKREADRLLSSATKGAKSKDSELGQMTAEITKLESENTELRALLAELRQRETDATSHLQLMKSDTTKYGSLNEALQNKIEQLSKQLEETKSKYMKVKGKKRNLVEDNGAMRKQLEGLKSSDSFKSQIEKEQKTEILRLTSELEGAKERVNLLQDEVKQVYGENSEKYSLLTSLDSYRGRLSEMDTRVSKKKAKVAKLKQTIEKLENEKSTGQKDAELMVESLSKELSVLKTKNEAFAQENSGAKSKIAEQENELKRLYAKVASTPLPNDQAYIDKINEKKKKISSLKNQVSKMESKSKTELEGNTNKIAQLTQEREDLNVQLHECKRLLVEKGVEIVNLKGESESGKEKIQMLEEEVRKVWTKSEDMLSAKKAQSKEEFVVELNEIKRMLLEKKKKLKDSKAENKKLEIGISELELTNASLKTENDAMMSHIRDLEMETKKMYNSVDKYRGQIESKCSISLVSNIDIEPVGYVKARGNKYLQSEGSERVFCTVKEMELAKKLKTLEDENNSLITSVETLEQARVVLAQEVERKVYEYNHEREKLMRAEMLCQEYNYRHIALANVYNNTRINNLVGIDDIQLKDIVVAVRNLSPTIDQFVMQQIASVSETKEAMTSLMPKICKCEIMLLKPENKQREVINDVLEEIEALERKTKCGSGMENNLKTCLSSVTELESKLEETTASTTSKSKCRNVLAGLRQNIIQCGTLFKANTSVVNAFIASVQCRLSSKQTRCVSPKSKAILKNNSSSIGPGVKPSPPPLMATRPQVRSDVVKCTFAGGRRFSIKNNRVTLEKERKGAELPPI